jgi:soluble lytic murein transglycosylase-like protein
MFEGVVGIEQRTPAKHSRPTVVHLIMRASFLIFFLAASAFAEPFTAPTNIKLKPHARVIVIQSAARVDVPFSGLIAEAARTYGVDARLIAEVMRRESRFNQSAVSPVGACGLMQLMPATARVFGITDIFDARQNIFGGTQYLRRLLDTYQGDLNRVLAAYNAGPGAVEKYNGVPPYAETRAYVASIRAHLDGGYDSPHFSLLRSTSK